MGLEWGQCPDLWHILQGGPGYPLVWIGDLGDDPQDQADPMGIPPQGGPLFIVDESLEHHNGAVVVPAFGYGSGGRSSRGG